MKKRFTIFVVLACLCCSAAKTSAAGRRESDDDGRERGGLTVLPLHTEGRWVVDSRGNRFKFNSVNWYGAEEKDFVVAGLELERLETIAHRTKAMGFNSVRLLWSNELFETNPVVRDAAVAANPQFEGQHAMDVLDAVVEALAREGLLVILDNHVSDAGWCCTDTDGNTLWYNARYPEKQWISDWQGMTERYKHQRAVVGVDLRNEVRGRASWGGNALTDWHAAAERGGDAVLRVNPNLLVIVEGIEYASNLKGVASLPVKLSVPQRVVYSAHDYSWYHHGIVSYEQLEAQLETAWGYILTPENEYTAPVWLGEFGTCHSQSSCLDDRAPGSQGFWFANLLKYMERNDIDWAYWALNGTAARAPSRTFGSEETYGVFDPYWNAPALPDELQPPPSINLLGRLQAISEPTQGPGELRRSPLRATITTPTNGSLFSADSRIAVSANAAEGREVDFYAGEQWIGTATNSPFTVEWSNVPEGTYNLRAIARETGGLGKLINNQVENHPISYPVQILVQDYDARNKDYGLSIGINFVGWTVTPMAPSEVAGVVPQDNWNQAYGNSGAVSALVDNAGTATNASVEWSSPNMYYTPIADVPGNNRLMKGYQDTSNTIPTTVEVKSIPASFEHYDIYVYFDGGNGPVARTANFRILTESNDEPNPSADATRSSKEFSGCPYGVMKQGTIITGLDAANTDFSGTFTLASGGAPGNYVLFPDCHGRSFRLLAVHGASTDSQYRAPVNAIQIVSITQDRKKEEP